MSISMDFPLECKNIVEKLKQMPTDVLIDTMTLWIHIEKMSIVKTVTINDNNEVEMSTKNKKINDSLQNSLKELEENIEKKVKEGVSAISEMHTYKLKSEIDNYKQRIDDFISRDQSHNEDKNNWKLDRDKLMDNHHKQLTQKSDNHHKQLTEINDIMNKERNNHHKELKEKDDIINKKNAHKSAVEIGNIGEKEVEAIIEEYLPDYIIKDVSKIPKHGDFELTDPRGNKIMVEVKNHIQSIRKTETEKFVRDIGYVNPYGGVFLSLKTSIHDCESFFVLKVHSGIPCVYISYFKNDPKTIKLAIEFINKMRESCPDIKQHSDIDELMNKFNSLDQIALNNYQENIDSIETLRINLINQRNELLYNKRKELLKNYFTIYKKVNPKPHHINGLDNIDDNENNNDNETDNKTDNETDNETDNDNENNNDNETDNKTDNETDNETDNDNENNEFNIINYIQPSQGDFITRKQLYAMIITSDIATIEDLDKSLEINKIKIIKTCKEPYLTKYNKDMNKDVKQITKVILDYKII